MICVRKKIRQFLETFSVTARVAAADNFLTLILFLKRKFHYLPMQQVSKVVIEESLLNIRSEVQKARGSS